jgi:hypothetical protein
VLVRVVLTRVATVEFLIVLRTGFDLATFYCGGSDVRGSGHRGGLIDFRFLCGGFTGLFLVVPFGEGDGLSDLGQTSFAY